MMRLHLQLTAIAGLGALTALAACSRDASPLAAAGTVPAAVKLASTSTTRVLGASMGEDTTHTFADSDDGHGGMRFFGRINLSDVDSLTVNVTKVEVLQAQMDTGRKSDSADAKEDSTEHASSDSAEAKEDSTERASSDTARGEGDHGDDHENDERTWISLDVTAGGHLNLLKLPDSAAAGITVATGTLPAGTYRHVRLFVTNATIYLKNQIVTPTGDTLKAGVALPVKIPSADSTGAAIKTDERFTVKLGSSTVQLFFDADDTVRHIVVTGDGTIILSPVIH